MKTLKKNWSAAFGLKPLQLKTPYFHTKLPCQKQILRQTEWRVQTGPKYFLNLGLYFFEN